MSKGTLSLKSVRVQIFNTIYDHKLDERGYSIDFLNFYGDVSTKEKTYDYTQIEILEELPNIVAKLIGEESDNGELIFEKS